LSKGARIKGFVLSLKRAKNEDMIVSILSDKELKAYYRFFGARHSILQLGYLVDFEIEGEGSSFMPRLRNLSHMGFSWIYDKNRLLLWHNFIKLFEPHLRDTVDIDNFYFNLLLNSARIWHKQNPKRIVCESYLKLLEYEGRLHETKYCYICEQKIEASISVMHGFLPAHPECIHAPSISIDKFNHFMTNRTTICLEDNEIEYLHGVIMRGI